MAAVGTIKEIWRYPVKSMRGEQLESCELGELGLFGDRGWALRDDEVGEIRGAKKLPGLMHCTAVYLEAPGEETIPEVRIELPDGTVLEGDAAVASRALSAFLGTAVTLWSRRPSDDREHYRRVVELDEPEIKRILGQSPEEPLADLSSLPADKLAEISEFTSPPGTYFDAYPIHLISTSWLETLARHTPGSRFEVARFRPNFVIEGAGRGLPELDWCGRRLAIGSAEIGCETPTIRCIMSARATGDLPTDMEVLRTAASATGRNIGAYANVTGSGRIKVGDAVELV